MFSCSKLENKFPFISEACVSLNARKKYEFGKMHFEFNSFSCTQSPLKCIYNYKTDYELLVQVCLKHKGKNAV